MASFLRTFLRKGTACLWHQTRQETGAAVMNLNRKVDVSSFSNIGWMMLHSKIYQILPDSFMKQVF